MLARPVYQHRFLCPYRFFDLQRSIPVVGVGRLEDRSASLAVGNLVEEGNRLAVAEDNRVADRHSSLAQHPEEGRSELVEDKPEGDPVVTKNQSLEY